MRWQKLVRIALVLFAGAFAVIVWRGIGTRTQSAGGAPTTAATRTDLKAVGESQQGVYTRLKLDKSDFKIEYEGLLTYSDGSSKFISPTIRVGQRGGRDFVLTGKEAESGKDQSNAIVRGNVRLAVSDGLVVTCTEATYSDGEGLVRVPGPVAFTRERMSGTAIGATYDKNRDVLWLLDKAHVIVQPDPETKADGADIVSGSAGLARRDKYIKFLNHVTMTRGGQTTEADEATAYLSEDEKRLQTLELRGHSRIRTPQQKAGEEARGPQQMSSDNANLSYADDGRTLQRAVLAGTSSIDIAGPEGAQARRVAGDVIDLIFAPDGASLTSLIARDRVQLDIPADRDAPARRIRAATLDGTGEAGRGLTAATFTGNVEFHETAPAAKTAPAIDRTVRGPTLKLALKSGFDAIEEARFLGGMSFKEADRSAEAPEGVYHIAKGFVHLSNPAATGAAAAHVQDAQMTVDAHTIDFALDGGSLQADGDVKSTLPPRKKEGPDARPRNTDGADGGSRMLDDDQPVFATAAKLAYNNESQKAVYTGQARLWQGETTVSGDEVTVDRRTNDLTATGSAISTFLVEQVNEQTKEKEKTIAIGRGATFVYEDAAGKATYTTGAHLNGPQGDLTADRIELFLDKSGDAVERAEAYTGVTLREPRRSAFGDRLTYFAADERYIMGGAPVKIVEETRETTGKILIFFKSTDRIVVDGKEDARTQTRSIKPPEQQRQFN